MNIMQFSAFSAAPSVVAVVPNGFSLDKDPLLITSLMFKAGLP